MFICQKSEKNMVLLKLNQTFRGSYVSYPLNKDGYALTFTGIKDFMLSLPENYDIELYNKDVCKRLFDTYGWKDWILS